jgi:hypothetical protein
MHKILALACVFLAAIVVWAGRSQPAHAADSYAWTTEATHTFYEGEMGFVHLDTATMRGALDHC